jgi:hypothetical protein
MNNSGMWFTARGVCFKHDRSVMKSNSPNSKEILSTSGNIASPPFFFHTEGKKGGNLKLPVLRPTICGIEFQLIEIKNIYTESNGIHR